MVAAMLAAFSEPQSATGTNWYLLAPNFQQLTLLAVTAPTAWAATLTPNGNDHKSCIGQLSGSSY
jgi:hypothetical protein